MCELSQARQCVSEAISLWQKGTLPDAASFLDSHPEVKSSHSLVMDLIYEEFHLRVKAGERVDTEKFCGRFPTIKHSVQRMISVYRALGSEVPESALDDVAWPEAGTRWLDWDLVEPLGRGAFSKVFLAREYALGNREVVLKCSFAGPHEAFILGSLSHPNIVPVHSSRLDEESGLAGISMPLLGRTTLAHVLDHLAEQGPTARTPDVFTTVSRKDPGSPSTRNRAAEYENAVVQWMEQVVRGLAAAHAADVVHGDIKPSNILRSSSGRPMLMDFNLSGGPEGDFARIGGTPPYMAPECANVFLPKELRSSQAAPLDRRSDIFSLGVVFLELLLGRIPLAFDFHSRDSLPTEKDWQNLIQNPDDAGHTIDAGLQRILERCLNFDPAQRYSSADELASELAGYLKSKQRARLTARRWAIAAAVAAMVSISATLAIASYPSARERALREARRCIAAKDFVTAQQVLRNMPIEPGDNWRDAWIGYCFAEAGEFKNAEVYLKAAVKEHENSAELWNDFGLCAVKFRRDADAEDRFSRALALKPRFQAVYHNRAVARRDRDTSKGAGISNECWQDFETALGLELASAELHYDVAAALAWAKFRNQRLPDNLEHHVAQALAGGRPRADFAGVGFEDLNLEKLESTVKERPPTEIPLSKPLILPPPFPLPIE